jgi:hypothetical protein
MSLKGLCPGIVQQKTNPTLLGEPNQMYTCQMPGLNPVSAFVVSSAWQPSLLENQASRPSFTGSFEGSQTSTRRLGEVTSALCLLMTAVVTLLLLDRLQREVHSEPSVFLRSGFFLLASFFTQTESLPILDPSLLPFKLFGCISTVNNPHTALLVERRDAGTVQMCLAQLQVCSQIVVDCVQEPLQ